MLRFIGWLFAVGFMVFVAGAAGVGYVLWTASKDLPDYTQLANYAPPVMTRIYAADGSMLAEYAEERRLFVPVNQMPKLLIDAFTSAEDKTFFQHGGLDWQGIAAAAWRYAQVKMTGKGQIVGASTITQQVAKNFLLTNERSIDRKLKEAILVRRIEQTFTKDQILELYLNEIFLGLNSYGVAAASLNYFGKSLDSLSLEEMAYLAALPKGPNNYHPFRQKERAIERRNWVLLQMHENGYITEEQMKAAQAKPLVVTPRPFGAQLFAAESFAEEVRRELIELYGKDKLEKGGLSVRTTLDPKLQLYARQSLARGLIAFDRKRGFRGPVAVGELGAVPDWALLMKDKRVPDDMAPWRLAVVLDVSDDAATIGLQPRTQPDGSMGPERDKARIPLELMQLGARLCRRHQARPRGQEGLRRAEARRHRLRRPQQGHRRLSPDADAGRRWRADRHGPAYRPRAGAGRRLLLWPQPVQPRRPGAAPAGLVVQAHRLCGGPRQRLFAGLRGDRCADRVQDAGRLDVEAQELPEQVLRPLDAAPRHRAVAQRDDGAARQRARHGQDHRPRHPPRHL